MKTIHKFLKGDSRKKIIENESVNLIVTSPPYPMIKMWDDIFINLNNKITLEKPEEAFNLMHKELEKIYKRCFDALKPGGVLIVNIGDATRTIKENFSLFPNGSRTIEICRKLGFNMLPQIHWWKPTNSPNKYMGSGMLPVGAYVTLENEHILIFRKGKREFLNHQKQNRSESAFFQNERNAWFSDIWSDINGARQTIKGLGRERNAAFPIKLAHRLICMYSVIGDVVWDPFGGTGTTTVAAIISGRNSIINDIDETFVQYSINRTAKLNMNELNKINANRIKEAKKSTKSKLKKKDKKGKYFNKNYGVVYTRQEVKIKLPVLKKLEKVKEGVEVEYE